MTTADISSGFWEFGWWLFGLEERGKKIALQATDWIVDRLRWASREVRRWKGYPTGDHRPGRHEKGISVWEYLHRIPLAELEYEWKPRGQHRDDRGWRYSGLSIAWGTIQRSREYREWRAFWRGEVDRMMDEIQYMLDHPPLPASVTVHGCHDCLCGQVAAFREESLV